MLWKIIDEHDKQEYLSAWEAVVRADERTQEAEKIVGSGPRETAVVNKRS
jgi:hypothetical protein